MSHRMRHLRARHFQIRQLFRMRYTAAVVAAAATTLALTGAAASAGAAVSGTAASGTEHFQLMSTSATATTAPVIAYGVFTGVAVDHTGNKVDTFVFSNGTFKVRHTPAKHGSRQHFNPRTCLFQLSQHGTYKLLSGTGKYAGITGHGTYQLTILFIGAKSNGKCSQSLPPLAFQQQIKAVGPVHL
jgi:hypothetical protein